MYILTARYGEMPVVGEFKSETGDLRMGQKVLLMTERGTEVGTVLKQPEAVEDESRQLPEGSFVRLCTGEDLKNTGEHNAEAVSREFLRCRELIKQHQLDMTLVHVEHLFGGEKIVFYFIADGRVDFRQLVKDLAHEYHTRIEMKQIGVRDEAKLKGDIEHCGQELCCRRYMNTFEPVTMKMAKNQKATLDPAKISGHCGRLMCCLRYENHVYDELMLNLPRKGSRILTKQGAGKVINSDILAQKVTIETDARVRLSVGVDEILGRDDSTPEQREAAAQSDRRPPRRSERPSRGDNGRRRNGDAQDGYVSSAQDGYASGAQDGYVSSAQNGNVSSAQNDSASVDGGQVEKAAEDKPEAKSEGDAKPSRRSRRGGKNRRKRNPKPQN